MSNTIWLHRAVYRATFLLLAVAWVLAVAWFIAAPNFEPALTSVALLATITGIFAERWFASKERRRQLITMLLQEIQLNCLIVDGPTFSRDASSSMKVFYPRLFTQAIDQFLWAGEFATAADRPFVYRLHRCRQVLSQVNRKIDAIEQRLFLTPPSDADQQRYREALTDSDGPITEARDALAEIDLAFRQQYLRDYEAAQSALFGAESRVAPSDDAGKQACQETH